MPPEQSDEIVPFQERMRVTRELMMTLDVVTYAGQHHVMHRALGILRRDIFRVRLGMTDLRIVTLAGALTDLEQEANLAVPRPAVFNDRARFVVDVLLEIWSENQAGAC